MSPHFNLLDEPWIRVTRLDGESDEVSLLTLFRESEDIEGIHGEIASQDVAILRLLLAICHRTMGGPEDLATWRGYWQTPGRLGADACDYLKHYRDRFDLRAPERPFFQVAGIHSASGKTSGLESLIADVPNGSPFFTTRIADGLTSVSWAEAARWLVHVHAFDPSGIRSGAVGDPQVNGGKGYPIGPGWTGQIGVITVTGKSLERTLLLNTVVCSVTPGLTEVDPMLDLAPWERDPDGPAGSASVQPTGPVSCYTWQTRRVLLHGDDASVTSLFLGNGDKATPQNRYLVEPLTAWRYSEPQTKKKHGATVYMPRKLPTDRAFWRGLSTLVAQLSPSVQVKHAGEVTRYRPPGVVTFYEELMHRRMVPLSGLLPLRATGIAYGSNESTVAELVDDVLSLPAGLLDPSNMRLITVVKDAMEESEQVASVVRNLASNLDRAGGGSPDTGTAARQRAGAAFYQVIDERFPRWLASLDETDPEAARNEWRELLRQEAYKQRDVLTSQSPETAFAGRGEGSNRMDVSRALFFFTRSLGLVLPSPQQDTPPAGSPERTTA
ncbi:MULTISPECIES: type I-E CRISPR-associated protein Cse1/CasA [unclassified Actinomyces]|uniref:type I-E CRISPR-associated protein Cse1/CasA n=1 Tax=unclassified Actinomyces TaxID=2609248 RepID=UPI00201811E3|nr:MULTISPECIES: type I-E CRISPR-associated protein Cse1/CasA [unclassified Actinomyces]MCL3778428.1 type I-E CRISPR-associated protein Cse1/CasA [Actinomyces sp. AC-20-1]MCL3790011.1 type I-E CRISPR-associated protein Cse1/CasA [Actinomyces sp. 187325]MCL3792555.1 type I-E CRISPR-associated protein Cse1/CasA [Actinomyces sp. 186855]MCL3794588.1 type I-E CRISPR-associated protein Cse1/CasA [Actinomyces sp. 217892]